LRATSTPSDPGLLPPATDCPVLTKRAELEALLSLVSAALAVPAAALAIDGHETLAAGAADLVAGPALCRMPLDTGAPVFVEDTAGDARFEGRPPGHGRSPLRFFAGVPVALETGRVIGALVVAGTKPRPLSLEDRQRLEETARIAAVLLVDARRAVEVGALTDALAEQIDRMRREQLAMERYRKMYERTSALGHIGVWECDLATEELTWTNGVYDIFELPRGAPVTREVVLGLYDRESRLRMERVRRRAIEACASGSLDIRIRTMTGQRRWVRLTIDVEAENGRAVRIFGLKQDITQERDLLERLRRLAEIDPMTGLANRSLFEGRLARALGPESRGAPAAALALIDLDGFKKLNDTFGHAAGDECLRQIGRRLRAVFRRPHEVGRIGGDEFAALVRGRRSEAEIAALAHQAIEEIRRPVVFGGHLLIVGASIGVTRPADLRAHDLGSLFAEADRAMYAAKRAGRNTVRFHVPDGGPAEGSRTASAHDRPRRRRLTARAGASTPAR
jgi:diguanylate cyclase (GGDEF)-like protein